MEGAAELRGEGAVVGEVSVGDGAGDPVAEVDDDSALQEEEVRTVSSRQNVYVGLERITV